MATVSSMPNAEVPRAGYAAPDLVAASSTPSQTPAPLDSAELESRANEYLSQERFNRSFTLPATDAHGELSVTYAVGGVDSADAPTMLFIGGMLGGRYLASIADYVATKYGMRIVVTDRPGLGGSTPVKPSLRLPVWLETVPVLMRTINARHVSLSAHSCGVIYAFNTIYKMPWILPPSNRKLYLFSPWVPPEHSGVTPLSIASQLPSALINSFDSIIRFVNNTVMPTVHFSSVISGVVSAPFSKGRSDNPTDSEQPAQKHERDDLCREYCGGSAAEIIARSKVITRCVFSESTRGCNHEALLCLRKDVAGSWGPCDNYESYAEALEARLKEYYRCAQSEEGYSNRFSTESSRETTQHRFVLKVFWAETDRMIGKKGEEYFDRCFQRFAGDGQASNGEHESCISYESGVIPDTDHDTLCLPQYGAISTILEDASRG